MKKLTVEIIGAGTMGKAIGSILKKRNLNLIFADRDVRQAKETAKACQGKVDKKFSYIAEADYIFIAVKPQDITHLAESIKGRIQEPVIIISIVAGVTLKRLEDLFAHKKIVRMMPNLGLVVGQGIAVWKAGDISTADKRQTKRLIDMITFNFETKNENSINAVTAISGSGPGYFFAFAQSLQRIAEDMGFSPRQARLLVETTFTGAAILQHGTSYQRLINQVASKSGTTMAALQVFKEQNLDRIIDLAVREAYRRAQELNV